MQIGALTWNLFHGRDWPPEPELQFRSGRWSGKPVASATHIGVNRDLWREFTDMICAAGWDVALLQECPPRWEPGFTRECKAEGHRVKTSRNWLEQLSWFIARRRPDLIGSSEGGSNLTLARGAAGKMVEKDDYELTDTPEKRMMVLTRLESGLSVANLHVSTAVPQAERELLAGAERAVEFADGGPLLFGGDFNVRPKGSDIYERLAERFGLVHPTGPDRLSHLLSRDMEIVEQPTKWPPEKREIKDPETGLAIRLSDHHPVQARFAWVR